MNVILLRHGDAQRRDAQNSEQGRGLTSEGREQVRTSAHAIARMGQKAQHVLTSPLARARQTGEEAAQVWGSDEVEVLEGLSTSFDISAVDDRLIELMRQDMECVCLVGHAPTLGDYIAYLIGAKPGMSQGVDLTKSGAGCVEINPAGRRLAGALRWLLRRDQLAALSQAKE
jgi:phosphohistidine phosphatase